MKKSEFETNARLEELSASAPRNPPTAPDKLTQAEQLDLAKTEAQIDSTKQDTKERKKYALLFFGLGCTWMMVITAILLLQGFGVIFKTVFKLSDTVILAAIGSTTVNILGIVYVVANYLFPKK